MKQFTPDRLEAFISKYKHTSTMMTVSEAQNLPYHILAFHALYENMLKFVIPLCSELPDSRSRAPVSASTHIIDITGMGFSHFWKIKKYLQGAISIATVHYPETLGHIFVSLLYQRILISRPDFSDMNICERLSVPLHLL